MAAMKTLSAFLECMFKFFIEPTMLITCQLRKSYIFFLYLFCDRNKNLIYICLNINLVKTKK